LALLGALCLGAAPALADTGVGPGLFVLNDGTTSAGIVGSLNLFAPPVVPVKVQLSAGGSFSQGSGSTFLATMEAEYEARHFFVGAGGGVVVEQIGSGPVFDFFLGGRLAPFVSLIGKFYRGSASGSCAALPQPPGSTVGGCSTETQSTGYVGLLFGLK
jgi:hypothetical protein